MIHLIDDNKGDKRQKEFGISFIENGTFADVLSHHEKLQHNSDLSFLTQAKCLLVHKTTQDCDDKGNFLDSIKNATKIIEEISKKGENIPLVVFSNSIDENASYDYESFPNYVYQLRKTTFYSNLYHFLLHYQTTGEIELRIIVFGKKYKVEEIKKCTSTILKSVSGFPSTSTFKLAYVQPLSVFEKLHKLSGISIPYKDFCNNLEDHPITVGEFIEKIRKIHRSFYSYGKYIYNWQD